MGRSRPRNYLVLAAAVIVVATVVSRGNLGKSSASHCKAVKTDSANGGSATVLATRTANANTRGADPNRGVLVIGDSVVAVAARSADPRPGVELYGYSGAEPCQYTAAHPTQLSRDWSRADQPKTVVINWNGNNPRHLTGTALVDAYRQDVTGQITWYLAHGATKVVLAAAVPSSFNNGTKEVSWKSTASSAGGFMLGNSHLNDLYKLLAVEFPGRVFYSEAAARSIHPSMTFNTTLHGHACIVDYIHETPYCAKIYAAALANLASTKAPANSSQ